MHAGMEIQVFRVYTHNVCMHVCNVGMHVCVSTIHTLVTVLYLLHTGDHIIVLEEEKV